MQNHQYEDAAAQEPMDREQAMAAGGEPLISGWLDAMLTDSLAFADDERDEEREFKIAAAREALRRLAPEGASLAERMQAVQYLCTFQAGQLALAEANSPHLPPEQRVAARRFARQTMALSSRQLALLDRLGRARRADQEDARYRAAVDEAQRQRSEIPRWSGAAGAMESMLDDGEKPRDGVAEAGSPAPTAPLGPDAPLNRHERRALAKRQRKARKRLAGAA